MDTGGGSCRDGEGDAKENDRGADGGGGLTCGACARGGGSGV